jgi:asparagine synthase (glutamine-hydrolysing)
MSGIVAYLCREADNKLPDRFRQAIRVVRYRGPDDEHVVCCNSSGRVTACRGGHYETSTFETNSSSIFAAAGLACCRLALENATDGPPIASSGAGLFVTCDGLIDNADDICRELEIAGEPLASPSTALIVLSAFRVWGTDCLSRFQGSFSIVVLDIARGRLVAARDRVGTRPLFIMRMNGLQVSSSVQSLLRLASQPARVNRESLHRYLRNNTMDHGEETFFAGVEQVPPGTYLDFSLTAASTARATRYHSLDTTPSTLGFREAAGRLAELVADAVRMQAAGKFRAGAALSGGLDSSLVAAALLRTRPSPVPCFVTCVPQVGNRDFVRSEQRWAEMVGKALKAPVHAVRVDSQAVRDTTDRVVRIQEEPFSSPVLNAQLVLFEQARERGIEVLLSGQGGDRLFAPHFHQVVHRMLVLLGRGKLESLRELLHACEASVDHAMTVRRMAATLMPRSLRAFRRGSHSCPAWLNEQWFGVNAPQLLGEGALPMLRFEDRNAAAASILNRMPIFATAVREFAVSLPPEYCLRPGYPVKAIEAEALRGVVPNEVLERRERSGFPVPVVEWAAESASWMSGRIAELARLPFLNFDPVKQTWEKVVSGTARSEDAFLIWRWYFLDAWLRNFNVRWD